MSQLPLRLKVLAGLTKVLEEIEPSAEFNHDLHNKVFRGRLLLGDENDPIPCITILEPPIPAEPIESRGHNVYSAGEWDLMIQGFVEDDPVHPTDPAHHFMAKVKQALVKEKRRAPRGGGDIFGLGMTIFEMNIGQGTVRPADFVSTRAYFWLMLSLKMSENHEDPYETSG